MALILELAPCRLDLLHSPDFIPPHLRRGTRSVITVHDLAFLRYPDLLDTYLTVGGLCHPADNLGALLAVAEHTGAGGADFLACTAGVRTGARVEGCRPVDGPVYTPAGWGAQAP